MELDSIVNILLDQKDQARKAETFPLPLPPVSQAGSDLVAQNRLPKHLYSRYH